MPRTQFYGRPTSAPTPTTEQAPIKRERTHYHADKRRIISRGLHCEDGPVVRLSRAEIDELAKIYTPPKVQNEQN